MKMKYTRQFDKMDCGPACIRMVASAYGKDYPLSYLRSLSHLTREGVSIAGIRDALKTIGMDSATFEMTTEQLREKCPLPAILHWEQNHFVVLYKVSRHRLTGNWQYHVANPAYGKHSFSEEHFAKFWLNGKQGVVVAVEPNEAFYVQQSVKQKHSFLRFAHKYVWPYRLEMSQSAAAMLFGILLSLIAPILTQSMVDDGIGMRDMNIIVSIMLAQLFIFLGTFSMNLISSWVTLYMSTRINIHVLSDYLTKLLRLPMTFFETKGVGDFQQRLGDHGRLQSFVTYASLQTFFSIISAPFYLAIIGLYSPIILIAYLLLTLASTAWMTYFFHRRKSLDYEQFKLNAESQNMQYELLQGITDVKLNSFVDYKLSEWRDVQERMYRMSQRVLKLGQIQGTGFTFIGQLRNLFITFWIATEVVNGNLTLGMMMSISAIIGQVNGPLSQLIGFLQQFQDAKISLERSEEVHLCRNEDSVLQKSLSKAHALDINVCDLCFSYAGTLGKPTLNHINFSIPAGKMTAIVGESGSGKTTLLKLILKFYSPTEGMITIGKDSLENITAESVRMASGIVMQENFIFSDTIRRNIVLGEEENSARLDEAIRVACLTDFVSEQPLGLETKIGADGVGVSGGEKQRIMIARAVYKNPQYLMLDEATSSLDAANECRITENLNEVFNGRTRIVIAHRLSTVKNADNIIVLRHGCVVEHGTHAELVAKQGYYYTLVKNQLEIDQ